MNTTSQEKARERQRRYREKNAAKFFLLNQERCRRYYSTHVVEINAKSRAYEKTHVEQVNAAKTRRLIEHPEQMMLQSARARAKRVGVPCTITASDILGCIPADGCCPITGLGFERGKGAGRHMSTSMSLDRIYPDLGYIPGNIAVISNMANTLKSDCVKPDVFRRLAEYVEGTLHPCASENVLAIAKNAVCVGGRSRTYYVRHTEKILLKSAKRRAQEGGLPFDITVDDIKECIPRDGVCPITQELLVVGVGKASRNSMSLDRINPCLGYVKGNVAVISLWANVLKRDCVEARIFRSLAQYIETHASNRTIGRAS